MEKIIDKNIDIAKKKLLWKKSKKPDGRFAG